MARNNMCILDSSELDRVRRKSFVSASLAPTPATEGATVLWLGGT